MQSARQLRVLHCPTLVGGNPPQLARAERAVGLESWCVAFHQNYLGYACDEVLWKARVSPVRDEGRRLRLLYRALTRFDVVHFNCGLSIMPSRIDPQPSPGSHLHGPLRTLYRCYAAMLWLTDLPLLKRAGKALFVTYQGDDARQGDFCRRHFAIHFADEVPAGYYSTASDARKREEIATFDRYADGIFALNPDLLHVLPPRARFLPYAHIEIDAWRPTGNPPGSKARPLVIHAPSHYGVKGTRFVLEAVSRLQAQGLDFDFRLIEGVPNSEARRMYEQADLVIDQLLAGWYGGLSVEMMALGKPAICYIRDEDLKFIDPEMRRDLPVVNATSETLHEVLRDLLAHRHRLADLGARSRAYVEKWHNPVKIASDLKSRYFASLSNQRSRAT